MVLYNLEELLLQGDSKIKGKLLHCLVNDTFELVLLNSAFIQWIKIFKVFSVSQSVNF